MRTNSLKLLAVTAMLFAMVNVTNAQQGNNGNQGQGKGKQCQQTSYGCQQAGAMCDNLNLTDAQKEQVNTLKVAHQKKMLALKNQLAEKQARLNTLETADNADMKAINTTIDEIGAIKTDMNKERSSHKQAVRKLLTDEQRLAFDTRGPKGQNGKGGHKRCMGY